MNVALLKDPHDEAMWDFCEELLTRLCGHPGVRFADPKMMFVSAQTFAT